MFRYYTGHTISVSQLQTAASEMEHSRQDVRPWDQGPWTGEGEGRAVNKPLDSRSNIPCLVWCTVNSGSHQALSCLSVQREHSPPVPALRTPVSLNAGGCQLAKQVSMCVWGGPSPKQWEEERILTNEEEASWVSQSGPCPQPLGCVRLSSSYLSEPQLPQGQCGDKMTR